MLRLEIVPSELWDEEHEVFLTNSGGTLLLEHSLLSVSKWEAKWKKPYLDRTKKTDAEFLDYVRCMTVNRSVSPDVYRGLTMPQLRKIQKYIDDPMTASTVREEKRLGHSGTKITSELIYYWMISAGIPFECERWHLNRLMMLLRICNAKSNPQKPMGKVEQAKYWTALNNARRAKYHSKG